MSLVIGLHGAKGSGKDLFYKIVKRAFPLHVVKKTAYADPIKREVCRIFGLADEDQYDLFKRNDVKYHLPGYMTHSVHGRQVVREIGMLMRSYDENQFTRYVEEQIATAPNAIWCITDLRFTNELKSIQNNLGGIIIKIQRTGFSYDGHETETELSDDVCDAVIANDGTEKQYEEKVIATMHAIIDSLDAYNKE
jgi:hypothetical protein